MKLKTSLFITVMALATTSVLFLFLITPQNYLNAALGLPGFGFEDTPFGGRIKYKIDCDAVCVTDGGDVGTFLEIGPPKGGKFMKTPLTKVYEFNSIKVMNWTLGLAINQGKICKKLNKIKSVIQRRIVCDKNGEGKEIKIMGTSKSP